MSNDLTLSESRALLGVPAPRPRAAAVQKSGALRLTEEHLQASVAHRLGGTATLVGRWERKIVGREDGCWEWTGCRHPNGHGRINNGRDQSLYAHRVAYEFLIGPVPAGTELDHLCRHPWCVNPLHLEPVAHITNVQRGASPTVVASRSGACLNGHPATPENVYRRRSTGAIVYCRACRRERRRQQQPGPRMSEAEFQRRILDYARVCGWLCHHDRPARTERGWRTAIEGHAGFLDLVLVRRGRLLILEVKSDDGELTDEEAVWLAALITVPGITARVVRPRNWPELETLLRRPEPTE